MAALIASPGAAQLLPVAAARRRPAARLARIVGGGVAEVAAQLGVGQRRAGGVGERLRRRAGARPRAGATTGMPRNGAHRAAAGGSVGSTARISARCTVRAPGAQPGQAAADVHQAGRVAGRAAPRRRCDSTWRILSASIAVDVSAFFSANVPPNPQHWSAAGSSTRSMPAHRAQQPQRLVADPQHPQRVAGRVVGDPVRVVRADVRRPRARRPAARTARRSAAATASARSASALVARRAGRPSRAGGAPTRRTTRTARPRRRSGSNDLDVVAHQRQRLALVAGVDVHLPAAGLRRPGTTTSWPSRSSSRTVAWPTSGNSASARQVTNSAIRISHRPPASGWLAARALDARTTSSGLEHHLAVLVAPRRSRASVEQQLGGGAPEQLRAAGAPTSAARRRPRRTRCRRSRRSRGRRARAGPAAPSPAAARARAGRWRRTRRSGGGWRAGPASRAPARRPSATSSAGGLEHHEVGRVEAAAGVRPLRRPRAGRRPGGATRGPPTNAMRRWPPSRRWVGGEVAAERRRRRTTEQWSGPAPRSTITTGVPRRASSASRGSAAVDRGDQHALDPLLLQEVEVGRLARRGPAPLLQRKTASPARVGGLLHALRDVGEERVAGVEHDVGQRAAAAAAQLAGRLVAHEARARRSRPAPACGCARPPPRAG